MGAQCADPGGDMLLLPHPASSSISWISTKPAYITSSENCPHSGHLTQWPHKDTLDARSGLMDTYMGE